MIFNTAKANKAIKDLTEAKGQIEASFKAKEAELNQVKGQIEALTNEVNGLKADKEAATKEIESLKAQLAEASKSANRQAAEILANVVLPFRQLRGHVVWPDYAQLSARLTNRRLETGAARLFGDDPRRSRFLRTVAQQQGLLQIYEDFCLQDDSDCAQCPFPEQMQRWV